MNPGLSASRISDPPLGLLSWSTYIFVLQKTGNGKQDCRGFWLTAGRLLYPASAGQRYQPIGKGTAPADVFVSTGEFGILDGVTFGLEHITETAGFRHSIYESATLFKA